MWRLSMWRLLFPIILLLLLFLCLCDEARSDTLKLPRPAGEIIPGTRFDIITVRQEEGELIGKRLEHLSNAWDLLFAKFMQNAEIDPAQDQLAQDQLAQKQLNQHRHRVILYRDQREYIAHLFRIEPEIARTNGFYHAPGRTAHFFLTEPRILFHEGTHQILAERFFGDASPTFRNNFWIVEGIALFMETLKVEEDYYRIGDILANRLYAAKVYRFERNHNLPIRQLTAMSAAEIQASRELQEIYSQSAALTHWLMFAEGGRYRTALFELLRQTYHNEATPETLSELTGLSYKELDAKYAEFLKTIPDDEP